MLDQLKNSNVTSTELKSKCFDYAASAVNGETKQFISEGKTAIVKTNKDKDICRLLNFINKIEVLHGVVGYCSPFHVAGKA